MTSENSARNYFDGKITVVFRKNNFLTREN